MLALKWFAKLFDSGGAFKRTLDESLFANVPNVVREACKPAGEVAVQLAVPFDRSPAVEGDRVELYCVRTTTVNEKGEEIPYAGQPVLFLKGNVEELNRTLDQSGADNVSLRVFPIDALLNRSLWQRPSYEFTLGPEDPTAMIGEAVDDVNATYGAFFSKALTGSGQSLTLDVKANKHLAAIQAAAKLLPDGWFWRVEPDGTVRARAWPTDATHSVTFGREVDAIVEASSLLNTFNHVVVAWGSGPTYTEDSDAASVAQYGKRSKLVSDSSIATLDAALARVAYELGFSQPTERTQVTVNARYLNETIQPGDTVKVLDIPATLPFAGVNRIARVEYDGSLAVLHLSEASNNLSNELRKFIINP